jgi:hypothetical protein
MSFARLKLCAINAFIAVALALMLIDSLPGSPQALQLAIQPVVRRMGIAQGPWSMFAPEPDRLNLRMRAEITYRDGKTAEWRSPDWRSQPLAQRWREHRHQEFGEMIATLEGEPVQEAWMRHLARTLRPDLPNADRGAAVRVILEEAEVPSAAEQPWTTWREPPRSGNSWTLPIEKFP